MTGYESKRAAAQDKFKGEEHMTKEEIIKALRDMAKYPTVTLPRDSEALKAAADLLAQPAQEPVGTFIKAEHGDYPILHWHKPYVAKVGDNLYTTPPQRPWVGLTNEERSGIEDYCEMIIGKAAFDAIEAALRSKNHE